MDKKILIWTSSSKKKMISTKRRLFRDLEIIILIDLTFRDLKQKKENVVYRIKRSQLAQTDHKLHGRKPYDEVLVIAGLRHVVDGENTLRRKLEETYTSRYVDVKPIDYAGFHL